MEAIFRRLEHGCELTPTAKSEGLFTMPKPLEPQGTHSFWLRAGMETRPYHARTVSMSQLGAGDS